jgi:hypothetical protein
MGLGKGKQETGLMIPEYLPTLCTFQLQSEAHVWLSVA